MSVEVQPGKDNAWTSERFLIWLLWTTGICFTLGLQLSRTDEVFYTGDAGVKTLMVRQFAAGAWQADLQLDADPWIRHLWDQGLYPLGPPFVYEVDGARFIQYPLFFPALTAPFYVLFGFRGLTILPLIGLWLIWGFFLIACRRCGFDSVSMAFGFAGLVFASPLTLYSAMFTEHTLAVGLSFAGFTLAMMPETRTVSRRQSLFAGLLMGIAFWLRPESSVYILGSFVALMGINKGSRLHLLQVAIAAAIPIVLYVGMNAWLFDSSLGFHHIQRYAPNQEYPDMPSMKIAAHLIEKLFYYYPILPALLGVFLIALLVRPGRRLVGDPPARHERSIWVGVLVFCLVSVFLLPNDGGKQYGPRYWSHLIPWLWLLATARFAALRMAKTQMAYFLMAVLVALTATGMWLSTVKGSRGVFVNYRERTLPALKLVRQMKADVVVVSHQWISQELQAAFETAPFVRVRTGLEFLSLVQGMAAEKRTKLLWFGLRPHQKSSGRKDGLAWRFSSPKPIGEYFVSAGSVWSIDEPEDDNINDASDNAGNSPEK